MTKNKPNDSEKLAVLISLIEQYEENPITKNQFALFDFKNQIKENSLSLEECCPPERGDDHVDVQNDNGTSTRIILLAD